MMTNEQVLQAYERARRARDETHFAKTVDVLAANKAVDEARAAVLARMIEPPNPVTGEMARKAMDEWAAARPAPGNAPDAG